MEVKETVKPALSRIYTKMRVKDTVICYPYDF